LRSWKNGEEIAYRIKKGVTSPLEVSFVSRTERDGHGTALEVEKACYPNLTAERARAEVGMRFLTDPSFTVKIDGQQIDFNDLPDKQIDRVELDVDDVGLVSILVVDTREADRTSKQHGVAWHVKGRLVGRCSWEGTGHERFLDGRRAEARRYTFIVSADGLEHAVSKDWSHFRSDDPLFQQTNEQVQNAIRTKLIELTKEKRTATTQAVQEALKTSVSRLSPLSREKWNAFLEEAQIACPSISEKELTQLAGVLAKLEEAKSTFGLIDQLDAMDTGDLDDLHKLLKEWTLGFAKIVLDEVQGRLRLVDELHKKVFDENTKEVQELQPLFKQGLWIFGPEYETIEFTSNVGMTKVIHSLFRSDLTGSLHRPDFAILPSGSVGLYSYPKYDDHGAEMGVDRLAIVELKKPGVPISTDEKGQAWKYVKELYDKGLLQDYSRVTCFVLGVSVDPNETGVRTEKDGRVCIYPLNYDTVLGRARSRLLKLYERVQDAPFLDTQRVEDFLNAQVAEQGAFALSSFDKSRPEKVAS